MTDFKLQLLLTARDDLSLAAGKAGAAMKNLEARFAGIRQAAQKVGDIGKGMMLAGGAIVAGVGLGVHAFQELEDSKVSLQNVLGTVDGMDKHFDSLSKKAITLGNTLPGSTRDFYDLATALHRGGASAEDMDRGLLEAAANLKVVQRIGSDVAGEGLATTSMAFKLTGEESIKYADIINRTANSSRLKVADFFEAMKFIGAPAKQMGLTGLNAATQMSTLMGALANTGIDPSQVGSAFQEGVNRMAEAKTKLMAGRGAITKEAKDILGSKGISLDFFDKAGNTSIPLIISQMEKLKVLTNEQRLKVGASIFGPQASRLALIGTSEFNEMAKKQAHAESLNNQIERETGTLSAKLKNFFGTASNAAATFFEPIANKMKVFLDGMNTLTGKLDGWAKANPRLAASIMGLVAGIGALLVVGGAALLIASKLVLAYTSVAPVAAGAMKMFYGGYAALRPVLAALTSSVWGTVTALWAQAVAFAASPLGWIVIAVVAVAGAAYLLWKNWAKVSGWFSSAFPGLTALMKAGVEVISSSAKGLWAALGPLVTSLKQEAIAVFHLLWDNLKALGSAIWSVISPVIGALKALWNILAPIVGPYLVGALKMLAVAAFAPLALAIGIVVGSVWVFIKGLTLLVRFFTAVVNGITYVIKAVTSFTSTMWKAGGGLIDAFAGGIKARVNVAVDAIKGVVGKIRRFLPFSPAKEGPLMDIHRVRLVETIAEGIRPGALVDKMRTVAGAARAAIPALLTVGASAAPGLMAGAHGPAQRPTIININIDARGAAPGTQQDITKAIQAAIPAIKRELARGDASQVRSGFMTR